MAQTYNSRPSSLLGLSEDPYTSWCMDEVVWTWAMHVESKVHEHTVGLKDPEQIKTTARAVRLALMGVGEEEIRGAAFVDPSMPPSDEVINAQARGEVDAPSTHRKDLKDPAEFLKEAAG